MFLSPQGQLSIEEFDGIGLDGEAAFGINTILTSSDIEIQAIEGATAIQVKCIIIQKPRISSFGFVEYRFHLDFTRHSKVYR